MWTVQGFVTAALPLSVPPSSLKSTNPDFRSSLRSQSAREEFESESNDSVYIGAELMDEQKYQRKYPDIAGLLHDTDMTYAEIAREIGVTKQLSCQARCQHGPLVLKMP